MAFCAKEISVDIAVGNVVGSNICNIFFVLGISANIKPLPFQTRNNVDLGVLILSSLMLFLFMFNGKKRSLDRWEAIICLILFLGYVAFLIVHQ
jgi:cation:H+ antiporter